MTKCKIILICVIVLCVYTGCHSDEEGLPSGGDTGKSLTVSLSPMITISATTRAEGATEPTTIPSVMPEKIGVFGYCNDSESQYESVFENMGMFYRYGEQIKQTTIDVNNWPAGNDWLYEPQQNWRAGRKYKFYAYAPYDNDDPQTKTVDIITPGFNNVKEFHRVRIPPISPVEYTIAEALLLVDSEVTPIFNMLHLTSRMRFLFAVGEDYSKLRDIRITKISISDVSEETPYWECVVTLKDNNEKADVVLSKSSSDKYVPTSEGVIELIAENTSDDPNYPGLLLDVAPKYTPFSSSYNMLSTIESTVLTVTYDVYDKAGVLVRKNQTVSNSINLANLGTFESGKCYDVKVLITPKYLYVLSDNDVQPDGVIFINN